MYIFVQNILPLLILNFQVISCFFVHSFKFAYFHLRTAMRYQRLLLAFFVVFFQESFKVFSCFYGTQSIYNLIQFSVSVNEVEPIFLSLIDTHIFSSFSQSIFEWLVPGPHAPRHLCHRVPSQSILDPCTLLFARWCDSFHFHSSSVWGWFLVG